MQGVPSSTGLRGAAPYAGRIVLTYSLTLEVLCTCRALYLAVSLHLAGRSESQQMTSRACQSELTRPHTLQLASAVALAAYVILTWP